MSFPRKPLGFSCQPNGVVVIVNVEAALRPRKRFSLQRERVLRGRGWANFSSLPLLLYSLNPVFPDYSFRRFFRLFLFCFFIRFIFYFFTLSYKPFFLLQSLTKRSTLSRFTLLPLVSYLFLPPSQFSLFLFSILTFVLDNRGA